MTDIGLLHQTAMSLVDDAWAAKNKGDHQAYAQLTEKAFEMERSAALSSPPGVEPTRSVLLRSAASLALELSRHRDAERLIAQGLSGEPPAAIAEELRGPLEQVHFERHLDLQGIRLGPDDFRMSIWGSAIGYGYADSDEFVGRVSKTEKLLFRTAERRKGRPYREQGQPDSSIRQDMKLYMMAPGRGSFSVVFKLGVPTDQKDLFKPSETTAIINDFLDCLDNFNGNRLDVLQKTIHDDAYYTNFVGLAKELAPDGEAVKAVDIVASTLSGPRHVTMDRPSRTRRSSVRQGGTKSPPKPTSIEVSGFLKFADELAKRNHIKIEKTDQTVIEIFVPLGMMSDIVRPRWGQYVTAVCKLGVRGSLELVEVIDAIEDE